MRDSNGTSSRRLLNFRAVAAAACLALLAFSNAHAQVTPDVNKLWTTIGSAGTVDETDVNKVFFDRAAVQMGRVLVVATGGSKRRGLVSTSQSAVIRYNVVPTDGLFTRIGQCNPGDDCPGIALRVRFLDTGAVARVLVRLIEVDMATGQETIRMTFDSNVPSIAPSNNYQEKAKSECGRNWGFDFKKKAYYIEGTLTGSAISIGVASGIQAVKIDTTSCIS